MGIPTFILKVAILWFLITLYSRSTNSAASLRETWIVVIGVMITGLVANWLLADLLGPFVSIISLAALYFLVDRVCGLSRSATNKICVWYVVAIIILQIFGYVMNIPVDSTSG